MMDGLEQNQNQKDLDDNKSGAGRPPTYSSPEELQVKIDEYFQGGHRMRKKVVGNAKDGFKEVEVPKITITDLVIFLGFDSRQSFYDYEKKPEFSYTIKKARLFIEREYEEQLDINPAGAIFALKNFGWSDKYEFDHSGEIDTGNETLETIATALTKLLTPKEDEAGSTEPTEPTAS